MAVAQADAGAHLLGPSGMMDGQVGVIRAALDAAGHRDTGILAYTAKYASAFYGPFREAVESQLRGDRKTYQQDAGNVRESLRELALDLEEGADLVMVKPAMAYLDVLRAVAEVSDVPVAAYQVSGRVRDGRGGRGERLAGPGPHDPGDAHRDPPRRRGRRAHLLGRRGRRPAGPRLGRDWPTWAFADSPAGMLPPRRGPRGRRRSIWWRNCTMSNDPASGGEQQPGWHGQQPYPGGYGQQPAAAGAAGRTRSYPPPPSRPAATVRRQPSWQQTAGQQRYPGYPAGTGGIPPQNEAPSFFGALFDFGFNSFATPVVIKVLYILGLVGIGLGYVAVVISGFAQTPVTASSR